MQPQFTRINKDIIAIKDELRELRETVILLGSVPDIGAVTGEMPSELSEAGAPLPDGTRMGSFLSSLSPWIFIIVGVVGLAAVGLWLFMRMSDADGIVPPKI